MAEVAVAGELDAAGLPEVNACLEELLAEGLLHLAVDLRGVTFADATALGVLVRAKGRLERAGGTMTVAYDGNHYLARLLRVTGLDALLG